MSVAEIASKIEPILSEYNVRYAGVFGSVARGEETPESDVDILVSMGKGASLFSFMELNQRLEDALGRKVDLVSTRAINKHVEPYIQKDVVTVYEHAEEV